MGRPVGIARRDAFAATPTVLLAGVTATHMTVFGMLRITPVTDDDVTEEVAAAVEALDDHDVAYRTNSMSTVVEAEDLGELMDAVRAAHEAVPGDHVSTLLQIDDMRSKELGADDKVAAVEEELGRDAAGDRD